MERKAQVSIFIIIAIVLVVLSASYLRVYFSQSINNVDIEVKPIYNFIDLCIKDTGEDAIIIIGKNGGYSSVNNLFTVDGNPYYIFNNENFMPSLDVVENELSLYIQKNIWDCFGNFSQFKSFDIRVGKINVKTKIYDNDVLYKSVIPVKIKKGERNFEFSEFESIIYARLGIIYKGIQTYMAEQMKYKKEVCISCIDSIANKNNLYFELKDYDHETILFTIFDNNTKIKGSEYSYSFANNYEIKENEII